MQILIMSHLWFFSLMQYILFVLTMTDNNIQSKIKLLNARKKTTNFTSYSHLCETVSFSTRFHHLIETWLHDFLSSLTLISSSSICARCGISLKHLLASRWIANTWRKKVKQRRETTQKKKHEPATDINFSFEWQLHSTINAMITISITHTSRMVRRKKIAENIRQLHNSFSLYKSTLTYQNQ